MHRKPRKYTHKYPNVVLGLVLGGSLALPAVQAQGGKRGPPKALISRHMKASCWRMACVLGKSVVKTDHQQWSTEFAQKFSVMQGHVLEGNRATLHDRSHKALEKVISTIFQNYDRRTENRSAGTSLRPLTQKKARIEMGKLMRYVALFSSTQADAKLSAKNYPAPVSPAIFKAILAQADQAGKLLHAVAQEVGAADTTMIDLAQMLADAVQGAKHLGQTTDAMLNAPERWSSPTLEQVVEQMRATNLSSG